MNIFWTVERIEKLRKMREIGVSNVEISQALGTTLSSVKTAYTRYINGKRPPKGQDAARSRLRKEQNKEWLANNRDTVNARRRALRTSRKGDVSGA